MAIEPVPALVILGPGEWLGEPHSNWFAVEYRGVIRALFLGEAEARAWRPFELRSSEPG